MHGCAPDAEIGNDAKIGNFVEVKAATIGEGAKVNHLSYIGDAGNRHRDNVGAGTVTCNYDGVMKHRTVIGADASSARTRCWWPRSRSGDAAMTGQRVGHHAADVPAGALALGRARQVNKPGLARRLMDRLRALKNERKS
jgi:bifunctional UDP-N-acetylglucosamine pyrophosphorylase/glucosamine-1-phosphate N-acetyltransferase